MPLARFSILGLAAGIAILALSFGSAVTAPTRPSPALALQLSPMAYALQSAQAYHPEITVAEKE